jgi:hypothetical protein
VPSHPIAPHGPALAIDWPPRGVRSPGLSTYFDMEDSSLWEVEPAKREYAPIRGGLTCCHSDHDDYVCPCERVPMSGLMGWRSVLECTSIKCVWMHMATSRQGLK